MSLASRAILIALMQLFLYIRDIISGANFPWSLSLATWYAAPSPREISVCQSANFYCTNWKADKGTPNCFLSEVYSKAYWKQNSAAPKTPHEIPNLALFKQEKGPLRPFTVGNIFSTGTLTSSIIICPVIDALKDSFPSI